MASVASSPPISYSDMSLEDLIDLIQARCKASKEQMDAPSIAENPHPTQANTIAMADKEDKKPLSS